MYSPHSDLTVGRRIRIALSLLVFGLACNLISTLSPTLQPQGGATELPGAGKAPTSPPRDLTQLPQYWFSPMPPLPIVPGRPFVGVEDFMELFKPGAAWETVSDRIHVFQLYGEWVGNHKYDSQLKEVIQDLNRRGLAIAFGTGPLDPEPGCGDGVEGFSSINEGVGNLEVIKNAGGNVVFLPMDEPYFFAHFYDGPNACHWSAEKVAKEVDEFIKKAKTVFPDVIVGDIEPLAGPAGSKEYQEWLDIFYRVNGYHLAFLHMDIDWARPNWTDEMRTLKEYGKQIGVPVGIIYNGNHFDPTGEAFLAATGERVKKLEVDAGVQPDHIIFDSWMDKPDRALPETEPYTWTGFINRYLTDKNSLGYQRIGIGANVALGKPVTVSRQFENQAGVLAVDGDLGTIWNSGGGGGEWIKIDLGGTYDIAEIHLSVSQYPDGRTVHQLYGSGPGSNPILYTTFDGNTTDGQLLSYRPASPLMGIQSIRIVTLETPSWAAWREIEVIATEQ